MAFSYAPVLSRDIRGRLFRPPSTVRRFTIGEADRFEFFLEFTRIENFLFDYVAELNLWKVHLPYGEIANHAHKRCAHCSHDRGRAAAARRRFSTRQVV